MSLANWLGLARDATAILASAAGLLTVAAFWSGGGALGLASSVAVASGAGVLGLALYGVLTGAAGVTAPVAFGVLAVLALAGAFYGAQAFGVRGLWLAFLCALGLGFAGALLWAFEGRAAAMTAPGAGALAAFFILALVTSGALGAAARSASMAVETSDSLQAQTEASSSPAWSAAGLRLAPPPLWFDCAYATLGGRASAPGKCRFTPPQTASVPAWTAPAGSGEAPVGGVGVDTDQGVSAASRAPDMALVAPAAPSAPAIPNAPASPDAATPSFDRSESGPLGGAERRVASIDPARIAAPAAKDRAASRSAEAAPPRETGITTGDIPPAPDPLNAPGADAGPTAPRAAPNPEIRRPGAARASLERDAPAARPLSEENPSKSQFICFPLTSMASDRLCPDPRFDLDDLDVRFVMAGGEARDAPVGVECSLDPEMGLHATLFVNLSGDLAGPLPKSSAGGDRVRKAEAVYAAATRVIGAARGAAEQGAPTRLSLYVAGGSSLQSPWAARDFAPGRADRIFDLASSGQALALLRRLKADTETVRKTTPGRDLAQELAAMARDRPEAGLDRSTSVVLLVTDAAALGLLTDAEAERVGAALAEAGLAVVAVEIASEADSDGGGLGLAPTPALSRLAEASGGSAFAVGDGEALFNRLRRAFDRSRRFCAVRVTAPVRFFEEGTLELKLRRRAERGCAYEQVATVECGLLRLEERIDPNE